MQAVCPKCRCELPEIGYRCENDGWFGVDIAELDYPETVVGRPLGGSFYALRRIGQGGMGTVYEGRQIEFNRSVAIKVLSTTHLTDAQVLARFEREAKSIARVNHPNVVKLIDSGIEAEGSVAYIVMEYVKGVELSNVPAYEISGQFIAHVTYQVLNALAEAHAMNVIHRDLKPDNIMLTNENGDPHFVKVLDFGLAALTDRAKITISGQALGTPWYMSPEQATASAVTCSSDIYSLGCILYELATSKPPFPGNRPFNVMMQHVNAQVPPLITRPEAELSPGMVNFILRCLEKQPEKRFQTANEALDALYALPELMVDGQSTPSQSLLQSMRQLSQLSEIRSDVISNISDVLKSGEVRSISRTAPHPGEITPHSGEISNRSGEIVGRSGEISSRSGEIVGRSGETSAVRSGEILTRSGRSISLDLSGVNESGSHPRQSRSESIVHALIPSSQDNPRVISQDRELAQLCADAPYAPSSMDSFVEKRFKLILAVALVIIVVLCIAIAYFTLRGNG